VRPQHWRVVGSTDIGLIKVRHAELSGASVQSTRHESKNSEQNPVVLLAIWNTSISNHEVSTQAGGGRFQSVSATLQQTGWLERILSARQQHLGKTNAARSGLLKSPQGLAVRHCCWGIAGRFTEADPRGKCDRATRACQISWR
jgi:hypothetical protein